MDEECFNPNSNLFEILADLVPWGLEYSYEGILKKLKPVYSMELEKKEYQNVFENSDGNLKIFGTPEELAKTVREYQDFPGSGEFFKFKPSKPCEEFEVVKDVAQVIFDDGKMYFLRKFGKDGQQSFVRQRTRLIENVDTETEFIRHNIIRTKHYTQPILVPDGRFLKPAADVFLQMLKGMFFGWKVFQKIEEDEWDVVEDVFYYTHDITSVEKSPYFLSQSDINEIREELVEKFMHLKHIDADSIEIPEELTVDAVKKELVKQKFVKYFPDCLDFLEEYFNEEIGPFSIFDVMTSCLIKSLCKKIPHLAEFFHNQGACQRIAKLPCCIGSATQPDCREEPTDEACVSDPQEPEIFEQCIEASETCIAKDKELTDAKNRISSLEMEMRKKEQEAKNKFERMRKELEEERARFEREREELFQLQAEKDEVIQQLLTEKDEVIQEQAEKDEVIQQTRDELASMTGLKQNIQLQLNRVLLEKANVEIEKQKVDEVNQSWQELIQNVRGHVNMETWNAVNFKLPMAMQPFLIDAQNRKRRLEECDWMAQAGHKVARFNLLTNEPDLHSFAQKHLAKFNEKFVVYKGQVEEQFTRIQASNLVTPSEFCPLPDHPDLPEVFYDIFDVLHRKDVATSCGICNSPPGDDPPSAWTQCNDVRCSMKFHKECIQKWFDEKKNRICTHCRKDTNIET